MSESEQAERSVRSGDLPPGKLDVIYIGGIPPLRQIWDDIKTVVRQRRELRRTVTRGLEPVRTKSGEPSPGDFDVIYIGGIPPLWQIWDDIKTVIRQRRELRNGVVKRDKMGPRA